MKNVFKNLFGKKNTSVQTYSQVENLLINLTGDIKN